MRVYYDDAGRILFTAKVSGGFNPPGQYIEVDDTAEVDPARHGVSDGELVELTLLTPERRDVLLDEIRRARGEARARFITVLPGQEMVYLEKRAEAEAFLAHPAPTPALFPMVFSEVGITAPTAAEVAAVWLNMSDLWRTASTVIEAATLKADGIVRAATLASEAEAAVAEMRATLADLAFG